MGIIKNFLIASEDNNFEPGILKGKTIVVLAILFLLSKIVTGILASHNTSFASDLTPENILAAINNERSIRNLLTLNTDSRLTRAAEYKAQDMINRHYFSHTNPEGEYIWPTITAYGYTPYIQLGENLAIEFSSTESLVQAWMNSPTHRANVLNENFKDQGMGVSFGNAQNGEYDSSIANTFGALVAGKKLPITTPVAPTVVEEQPSPAPAPAPTAPKKKVAVQPKQTTPTPAPSPVPTSTPLTTIRPTSTPPEVSKKISIVKNSLSLNTAVKGETVVMDMFVEVEGSPDTVVASAADKTVLLDKTATTSQTSVFSGELKIPVSAAADSQLHIVAQDRTGQNDTLTAPLKDVVKLPNISAPAVQAPAAQKNKFDFAKISRYATLGIGIILLLFMLTDMKIIVERKFEHLDKKANNFILLLLAIITVAAMYWL